MMNVSEVLMWRLGVLLIVLVSLAGCGQRGNCHGYNCERVDYISKQHPRLGSKAWADARNTCEKLVDESLQEKAKPQLLPVVVCDMACVPALQFVWTADAIDARDKLDRMVDTCMEHKGWVRCWYYVDRNKTPKSVTKLGWACKKKP